MNGTVEKWRGLQMLVEEAVEHGSRAIERVQLETARRPFRLLALVPALAPAAGLVHAVHDAAVRTSHRSVRTVNAVVGAGTRAALDVAFASRIESSHDETRPA